MISYFSNESAISEILQLSTSLLGTAISIAAIVYTLFLAFATNDVKNGRTLIKEYELKRLILWTIFASVFEMMAVLFSLLWSILVKTKFIINYNILFGLGVFSVLFLLTGLVLVFVGLTGIVKQLRSQQ